METDTGISTFCKFDQTYFSREAPLGAHGIPKLRKSTKPDDFQILGFIANLIQPVEKVGNGWKFDLENVDLRKEKAY